MEAEETRSAKTENQGGETNDRGSESGEDRVFKTTDAVPPDPDDDKGGAFPLEG